MPIGSAKLALKQGPLEAARVTLDPWSQIVAGPNGEITSGLVESTVIGGSGPFTYQWEQFFPGVLATIDSPTSPDTTFTASGTNLSVTYGFRLVVTDTGAGNNTFDADCYVRFDFGEA